MTKEEKQKGMPRKQPSSGDATSPNEVDHESSSSSSSPIQPHTPTFTSRPPPTNVSANVNNNTVASPPTGSSTSTSASSNSTGDEGTATAVATAADIASLEVTPEKQMHRHHHHSADSSAPASHDRHHGHHRHKSPRGKNQTGASNSNNSNSGAPSSSSSSMPPRGGSLGSLFAAGQSGGSASDGSRQSSPTRHHHHHHHQQRYWRHSNNPTPIQLEEEMSEYEQQEAKRFSLYYFPVVLRSLVMTALPLTITQWAYLLLENVAYFFAARHAEAFIVAGDRFMHQDYYKTKLGAETVRQTIRQDEQSMYDGNQDNSPAATAVICVTIGFALVYLTTVILIGIIMALDTLCSHLSLPAPATAADTKEDKESKKDKKDPADTPLEAGDDDDDDWHGGVRTERFVTTRRGQHSPTLLTPNHRNFCGSSNQQSSHQQPQQQRRLGLSKFQSRSMENFVNFSASSLDDLTDLGDMLRSAATHEVISSIVDQALTLLMSACVCVGATYVVLLVVWLSAGLAAVDQWLDPSVQRGVKTYVLVCMLFQVVPVVGAQILIKYMQNVTYTSFRHHHSATKSKQQKGRSNAAAEETASVSSSSSSSCSDSDEDKTEQEIIRKKFKTAVMRPVLFSAAAITLISPLVQYCTVALAYKAVQWGALLHAFNVRKEWAGTYFVRNLGIFSSVDGGVPVNTISWLVFALAVGQCLISWTEFLVLFYQFSPYPHELRAEAAAVRQQRRSSPQRKKHQRRQWYGATDDSKVITFPCIATTSPPASSSTHPYISTPQQDGSAGIFPNVVPKFADDPTPTKDADEKSDKDVTSKVDESVLLFPRLTVRTWAVQYWNPYSIVSYFRTALYSVAAFVVEGFTVNAMLLLVSVTGCSSPNEVGGFYLAMQAAFVFFPIVYGIGSASTTTVGIAFRRLRDGHLAKSTAVTSLCVAIVLSIVNASVLLVAAPYIIPALFSVEHNQHSPSDGHIDKAAHAHAHAGKSRGMIHAAIQVVPYVAMYHIMDFLQFVLQSLMRGIGRFNLLVGTTFVAQWVVGLPLGVHLLASACDLHHTGSKGGGGGAVHQYHISSIWSSHFFSDVRNAAAGGTSSTGPPLIIVGYVLGILVFELPVFFFALFCATKWWDPDETAMKHYHPQHHMSLKHHQQHPHHNSALRHSPTNSPNILKQQQQDSQPFSLDGEDDLERTTSSDLQGGRRVHFSHSAENRN